MKKSVLICIFILIIGSMFLISCGEEKELEENQEEAKSSIIGEWKLEKGNIDNDEIVFYEDGTCWVNYDEIGKWDIVNNRLSIIGGHGGDFFSNGEKVIGDMQLDGDTLTLDNLIIEGRERGGTLVYKRIN